MLSPVTFLLCSFKVLRTIVDIEDILVVDPVLLLLGVGFFWQYRANQRIECDIVYSPQTPQYLFLFETRGLSRLRKCLNIYY